MIGVFYTQQHYQDHMLPILQACDIPWAVTTRGEAREFPLVLVASGGDMQILGGDVPYVYVEHGSGQSYEPWFHPSGYSGGAGHDGCAGFIAPSVRVATRWRARYPWVPAVAVGCPKLDPWHRGEHQPPTEFTVAVTFHWDANVSKFSRWAFPHYRRELPAVIDAWRRQGWIVIGHGHPRAAETLERYWRDVGVEWVPRYGDVFDRANILVGDNTSLLPEFASLGRPVVFLNAPWYNRDKAVGGRFWEWMSAGPYVDDGAALADLDLNSLALLDPYRAGREEMVRSVYASTDGRAALRAAEFLTNIYEGI